MTALTQYNVQPSINHQYIILTSARLTCASEASNIKTFRAT